MAGRIMVYLTAPVVRPEISCLDERRNSTISGRVAMAAAGHQRTPFGVDRALQAAQGQGQGVVVGRAHDDQRADEVVPRGDEGDQPQGAQSRLEQGQDDARVDAQLAATVYARRLDQLARDRAADELSHQEDAEGAGRAGDVERPRLVDPAQHVHDDEGRDHAHEGGQQHRAHHQAEKDRLESELEHRKRIAAHRAEQQGQRGGCQRDVDTPAEVAPERQAAGENLQIAQQIVTKPERRRQAEDFGAGMGGEHEHEIERRQHDEHADGDEAVSRCLGEVLGLHLRWPNNRCVTAVSTATTMNNNHDIALAAPKSLKSKAMRYR